MSFKGKIISIIILVLIILGGIIFLIILPTIKDIQKINQTIYNERVDLERKYLRGQLLKNIMENFKKTKPYQNKILSIFIPEGEELKFITDLEEIAEKNNVSQVINLDSQKTKKIKGTNFLSLRLVIKGELLPLLHYLRDLEKLNYYFNVSFINLITTSKEVGVESPEITMSLTGEVYSRFYRQN